MRLRRFEIRNYKCIEHVTLEWEDLIVLIGENNAGKSSVLSAIAVFLSGSSIKDSSLFRRHQTDDANAIELIGHFDSLTEEEKGQVAVRGRMDGDQWVLKKRYWFEAGEDGEAGGWKEQLYSFSGVEQFVGWPDPDATWAAFPGDYQPMIDALPNKGARPNAGSRESLRAAVREQRPDLVAVTAPTWVANPGGGGNWKSNANSILPRPILVKAVQEASDETNAKDATTYGKLVNLIVERSLAQRREMAALQTALDDVLALFRPDPANPQRQAQEVRDLQDRINQSLNEVVGGQALIRTEAPELRTMVLPSTSLVIRDAQAGIDTEVGHQGHGLQRTLVITLLQLLADAQAQDQQAAGAGLQRGTILLIEEPELYLHPQMERLMRDVLHRLATQPNTQVACCTHSPVFLDIANKYRAIVRMFKTPQGDAACYQVSQDLFPGAAHQADKQRLQTVARFHPTVNELFFAKSVVLLEEGSAIAAFERGADLMGLFQRHMRLRREVTLVDCNGKKNIPAFQRVLNAFCIPYRVVHDGDTNNPAAFADNGPIAAALPAGGAHLIHQVLPDDLEGLLGYVAAKGSSKPYIAVCTVEDLHAQGQLPAAFQEAVCMTYFGQPAEPPPAP
jgi:ABC-type thiamine transport system ATPase subunit